MRGRIVVGLVLGLLLLGAGPVSAQDETPTPYEFALQRIEAARASGATTWILPGWD